METTTETNKDIGYAVTATLPDRYLIIDLYVAVPGGSKNPDEWARARAAGQLKRLAAYVPEAKLEITALRRVN